MKNRLQHNFDSGRRAARGFTLPEFAMSLALVGIIGAGLMTAYLFTAKICVRTQAKLDLAATVREMTTDFGSDVRSAVNFDIGQGSGTNFTPVAEGLPRQGNSLQIYPTASTNIWMRYYMDAASQTLKYIDSDDTSSYVLVEGVTNATPFTAEDLFGNVATNELPKELVGMSLVFNPEVIRYSTNAAQNVSDFYRICTRINRRNGLGHQQ
jgi:prepilin-type N-terminal cleavage/methylation domain-containing protein